MDEPGEYPEAERPPGLEPRRVAGVSRGSLIVRSVLWIVIGSVFLFWNLHRILQLRALGFRVSWWAYAQVVIWAVALAFWLRTGWRDLKRRDSGRSLR